ncbi:MAG: cyclopropane fatty acyl phospholipid synthase [Candidatus Margulisbacteria bacterium]|nr:cyclopropane fatty acyl phospholipid synthase [Candidatus Margulisiibacteriota bacterium]
MATGTQELQTILAPRDIKIDGKRPWDIQIHDKRNFVTALSRGTLGLGESYIQGIWDCQKLDKLTYLFLKDRINNQIKNIHIALYMLWGRLWNYQSSKRAFQVGQLHYDLGNDLFENMLDKRMIYSCAYWKDARTLEKAQEAKLELICRKLKLQPGMKVLDIGCGWGGLAKYMAENYNVNVVGITISKEQAQLARENCNGLPVEIKLQDYRKLEGQFDAIVSVGMFEHVGYKNYSTYMKIVRRLLKDDGLFLLHTIGGNDSKTRGEPWLEKYIFRNGMLPSIQWIAKASEKVLVMEDWQNFGAYYDQTLMAWDKNFEKNWPKLKEHYSDTFYRMWRYYLLTCAGAFRARNIHLWQIVFSKQGYKGVYHYA